MRERGLTGIEDDSVRQLHLGMDADRPLRFGPLNERQLRQKRAGREQDCEQRSADKEKVSRKGHSMLHAPSTFRHVSQSARTMASSGEGDEREPRPFFPKVAASAPASHRPALTSLRTRVQQSCFTTGSR
jgi:hypothetical protein